ncbi:MAG TPA: hypothetical protein VLB45_00305 [Nitrosopumilaceae archaeon]|nr:hypothetical protein [Nitrosopumilaceae archaeon]
MTFSGLKVSNKVLSDSQRQEFLVFLRMMSKKGFYEILLYVKDKENVGYNQVLKYAIDKKIVDSRASITIILNGLTYLGLLERTVTSDRPVRTNYEVTKTGNHVIKAFKDLEHIL